MMRALLILCACLLSAPAWANTPYAHWLLDLSRAEGDAAKLEALTKAEPTHAFTWLAAHTFDLGLVAVPAPEKARLRRIAEPLATTLAAGGDTTARLWLDAADREQLAPLAQRLRVARDAALRVDLSEPMAAVLPALLDRSDLSRALVHDLLHSAARDKKRLGGTRRAAHMLAVAQRLAADHAELLGDLRPWTAVADAASPPASRVPAAQSERAALAAWAAGDHAKALGLADAALRGEQSRRGATARTALLEAAKAHMLLALARAPEALQAWRRTVDGLAGLRLTWASRWARIAHARGLAQVKRTDEAAQQAALLAEAAGQMTDPSGLEGLLALADALRAAGEARVTAGDLAGAERLLAGADGLYGPLRGRGVIARSVPAAQQAAAQAQRDEAAGRVALARSDAAWARGRRIQALERAQAAAEILPEPARGPAWAAITRYAHGLGRLDVADQAAVSAAKALTEPVARARHRLHMAWLRLSQGRLPAAFALANAGLSRLRQAGAADAQAPLRARLHHAAGAALMGAGYPAEAEARWAFGVRLHGEPALLLALADAQAARGDAAAALAGLGDRREPALRIARGCLAAGLGDSARALMETEGLFPRDPVWIHRRAVCRALAYLGQGKRGPAGTALGRAATAEGPHTPPADVARRARVAAALEGGSRAVSRRREAIAAWRAARGDDLGLPPEPGFVRWDGGPAALLDRQAAAGGGLADAVWWAAQQAAVSRPGPDAAAVRATRAAVAGAQAALSRAPTDADRAHARDRLAVALRRLGDARRARAAADPRWAALVRPPAVADQALAPPAGTARLYFQTGPAKGRVWLFLPGQPVPRSWALPGRDALAAAVKATRDAYAAPAPWPADGADPHAQVWATVARATAPLLAWARDAAVATRLEGLTLEVWADGPLAGFPLEAAVLAPPSRPGVAPTFVGSHWAVTHRPGVAPTLADGPGTGFTRTGPVGADEAAVAAALGDAARRLTDGDVQAALSGGVGWFAGPLPAGALVDRIGLKAAVLGQDAAPPAPLLRWAGLSTLLAPNGLGPADPAAAAALWARLAGRSPVYTLSFAAGPDGVRGALTPGWKPGAGPDLPVAQALRAWQTHALSVPPVAGQIPAHHPSHWARWRLVRP